MDEEILNKLKCSRRLAKSPVKISKKEATETFRTDDSLSKTIRNAKEAAIFLSELDTIVKAAGKNNCIIVV